MTKKQFENLKIGDFVTALGGPNKGVPMYVTEKYYDCDGGGCLTAHGVKPNTVYNQRKNYRNDNWTCGNAHCFKPV